MFELGFLKVWKSRIYDNIYAVASAVQVIQFPKRRTDQYIS